MDTVGYDKVAFGPDYLDTAYFSRKFKTKLMIPDALLTLDGLINLTERMSVMLSSEGVRRLAAGNVEQLLCNS